MKKFHRNEKKKRKEKKTHTHCFRNFQVAPRLLQKKKKKKKKEKKKGADVEVDSLATLSYKIWNATLQSSN